MRIQLDHAIVLPGTGRLPQRYSQGRRHRVPKRPARRHRHAGQHRSRRSNRLLDSTGRACPGSTDRQLCAVTESGDARWRVTSLCRAQPGFGAAALSGRESGFPNGLAVCAPRSAARPVPALRRALSVGGRVGLCPALEVVALDLSIQRAARNPERARRLRQIAVHALHRPHDGLSLGFLEACRR